MIEVEKRTKEVKEQRIPIQSDLDRLAEREGLSLQERRLLGQDLNDMRGYNNLS